jgi:imidazolonepropionase-like amidohydrolase
VARAAASFSAMQRSVATLNAAGVQIGFGTDAGAVPDHVHAFTDHRELQLMVQSGMSPAQALTAATRTAAEIVGLEKTVGTIADGKSADFVILDANPLDDIVNTRRISGVYLRGLPIDRDALRAGWRSDTGGQR